MTATAATILLLIAMIGPAVAARADAPGPPLELEPGDRIGLVGNTLAERSQHFGYFETLLHTRFPDHQVYVRNLAYPADQVALQPREAGFGSIDDHLAQHEATVVLAFFGFNESFAGRDGLPAFKADLAAFIEHTQTQQYKPEQPPRLVLISPIAAENADDDQHASAEDLNHRLQLYTRAMRDVAAEHDVRFVDAFTPTRQVMADADEPLTTNGVHLNDRGYRQLARVLDAGLFGETGAAEDLDPALREEILARNDAFFYSYRAVNGVTIYGPWSGLSHQPDPSITNADVLEREREIFQAMAANRDRRLWAIARSDDPPAIAEPDDLPPQIEVQTNYEGDHEYLYGDDALATFTLADGYEIELFASEQEFPELQNPVALRFDGDGRLWVSTMPLFPSRRPDQPLRGKLLVFEDTNGDGRADDMTVFADGLHVVNGFELGDGGVYVSAQPHLLFLADTTGDGKADRREKLLHGFGSADSHQAISTFTWAPDGAMFMSEGIWPASNVETPHGPVRLEGSGVFRYLPDRHQLDVFISYAFLNPWGHVFDRWGMDLIINADSPEGYYGALMSGRIDYPDTQPPAPHFSLVRRPNAGAQLISSGHFPGPSQDNLLLATMAGGFHGIREFTIREDGAAVDSAHVRDLLVSDDRAFRPIEMEFGPDGALYLTDFHSLLIGHMTHQQRDPKRDHTHGRIYRITHTQRPLLDPEQVAGRPIPELLDLLTAPKDRTIYRARRELRERYPDAVLSQARQWEQELDQDHPEYERHLLEVLWLHQARGVVDRPRLQRLLDADDYRVRASATRALRYHLDELDDGLPLLKQQVQDDHPRVRLEAVIALSYLDGEEAIETARLVQQHPMDRHLEYALQRTLAALEATP